MPESMLDNVSENTRKIMQSEQDSAVINYHIIINAWKQAEERRETANRNQKTNFTPFPSQQNYKKPSN